MVITIKMRSFDNFDVNICNRFCNGTLPSDIVVDVDGVKFHLHKVLLFLCSFLFIFGVGLPVIYCTFLDKCLA